MEGSEKEIDVLEPIVCFTCPKCGKTLEMRQTEHNNLTQMDKYHRPKSGNREDISEGEDFDDLVKNYCMHFQRQPEISFPEELCIGIPPIVFSSVNKREDNMATLEAALKAVKESRLGVSVRANTSKFELIGFADIWKCRDRYYGLLRGKMLTPERFVATKDFGDIAEFAKKWYNWPKQKSDWLKEKE